MSDTAPGFVIESREHLWSLLAEAAEIEHNLMCCYLYAAFSLKERADEDLTALELEAVQRWRREILNVALDEMAHLALVSNLTSALGGVPHFGRANFPIPSGYHPAGVVVKLAPFNLATLEHFIYLERPEEAADADGSGFEPAQRYVRVATAGRLMPTSHDYTTVGALYRAIREGMERLSRVMGEQSLFIGDPAHQLGPEVTALPGVTRVRCLTTALAALQGIIVQGEGAPGHAEASHYRRFLGIRAELQALRAARDGFVPARPAAHNPVMRKPPTPENKVWIELEPAVGLLDFVNAAYTHMLRLLAQAYAESRGAVVQRALVGAATDLMLAISPLASFLSGLPASSERPDCTAGMSFATVRGYAALPAGAKADRVLGERLDEIVERARRLESELPGAPRVAASLARTSARLQSELAAAAEAALGAQTPGTPLPAPAPAAREVAAAPAAATAASSSADGVERAEGKALTLEFEAKRCIHARHCVLGQPGVFKANVQGPWLDADAASVEALVTVAHLCPSGAIRYRRKDGGANEAAPAVNLIQLRENGPLGFRGELHLDGKPAGYRATLCRCGASQNKPFCDGSHVSTAFVASGEPATRPSEPLAVRDGVVDVRPQRNGPLVVSGNVEVCAGTGRTIDRLTSVRLCRCGGSANKPFCDGSHARIGFQAD